MGVISEQLKNLVRHLLHRRGLRLAPDDLRERRPDFSEDDLALVEQVRSLTLTSPSRIVALKDMVEYVTANGIPGCFVECGVWRGGSAIAAMRTLLSRGRTDVDFYLFDTYEGMPDPAEDDVRVDGTLARTIYEANQASSGESRWARSELSSVKDNVSQVGYPMDRIHFIKGRVEDTLPDHAPGEIAILRLDTDLYSSTKHELECLYPSVQQGGIVFIDDYGCWLGSKKAVDEYLDTLCFQPLLFRIDSSARALVKQKIFRPDGRPEGDGRQ